MENLIYKACVVLFCGVLYRWGGGGFDFAPWPLNIGWKPARRYLLPLFLAYLSGWWIPMTLLSIILHFNLEEIKTRRWDDVCTYGFAQAWCFAGAGWISGLIGAWWFVGTWFSNIGIQTEMFCPRRLGVPMHWTKCKIDLRLDWFWVELVQGCLMGLVLVN